MRAHFCENIVEPLQDFIIPEPKHAKAAFREHHGVARFVISLSIAVDLNYQRSLHAYEIGMATADQTLTAKHELGEGALQRIPQ